MRRTYSWLLALTLALPVGVYAAAETDAPPTIKGVSVNGEKVSAESVQKMYDRLVNLYKTAGKPLPNILLNKLATIARDQAIKQTVVKQYVDGNKITATPEAVQEEVARVKDDLAARGMPWADYLKRQNQTDEEFSADAASLVAFTQSFKDTLDQDKLKAAFAKEKDRIPVRRAARILFMHARSQETKQKQRSMEEAQRMADAALAMIRNGQDYDLVAKEQGDERDNLDAGWFNFDAKKRAFSEALFALPKLGDVSPVVDTPDGFQILKLTGLRSEDDVWQFFLKISLDRKAQTVADDLVKKAKIEDEK